MPARKFKFTYWEEDAHKAAKMLNVALKAEVMVKAYCKRLLENAAEFQLQEEDYIYLNNLGGFDHE